MHPAPARHDLVLRRRAAVAEAPGRGPQHRRVDRAGTDRVDPHARARLVEGHGPDERVERALARGIGRDLGLRAVGLDRRDDHDRPAAALPEMGQGSPGGKEDALHVDREDLVPGRLVGVDDVAVALDPGRRDERIEPAVALDRGRDTPAPRRADRSRRPRSPAPPRRRRGSAWTVASTASTSWPHTPTEAPSAASSSATARPMPCDPPVTRATVPLNSAARAGAVAPPTAAAPSSVALMAPRPRARGAAPAGSRWRGPGRGCSRPPSSCSPRCPRRRSWPARGRR